MTKILPPPRPSPDSDSDSDSYSNTDSDEKLDAIFGQDKKNEIITYENAIKKSKMSICNEKESCFPGSCCHPILSQDEESCNDEISQFLNCPTKDSFQKVNSNLEQITGEDLVDFVLKKDHHQVMHVILDNLYVPISSKMLAKVVENGSPKMTKIFLAKKKEMLQSKYKQGP